jgi:hypothetical protein
MFRKSQRDGFGSPVDLLDHEIIQEQASALGRMGRALEAALAALRDFDAAHPVSNALPADRQARRALVAEAGHALWMFAVQREACGLRDSRALMRDYKVPPDVQQRMGAFPARRSQDDCDLDAARRLAAHHFDEEGR